MKSLLIGVDASQACDKVFEFALGWARRYGLLLGAVGIVDEPGLHGSEEVLLGQRYFQQLNEGLLQELGEKIQECLDGMARRSKEAGVAFVASRELGDPAPRIAREAQRYDLIMMAQRTHFRFGYEEVPDDTVTRVLARCPRPVVVVPEGASDADPVVVGYDGSLQAARSLAAFRATGLPAGRPVTVVRVGDRGEDADALERAMAYLQIHGIDAEPRELKERRDVAPALIEQASQLGAGLLVLGAYGQSGLREFLLGSVTKSILKTSTVPVFLYH